MFPVSLGLWHFDLLSGVKIAYKGKWGVRKFCKGKESTRYNIILTRK